MFLAIKRENPPTDPSDFGTVIPQRQQTEVTRGADEQVNFNKLDELVRSTEEAPDSSADEKADFSQLDKLVQSIEETPDSSAVEQVNFSQLDELVQSTSPVIEARNDISSNSRVVASVSKMQT